MLFPNAMSYRSKSRNAEVLAKREATKKTTRILQMNARLSSQSLTLALGVSTTDPANLLLGPAFIFPSKINSQVAVAWPWMSALRRPQYFTKSLA